MKRKITRIWNGLLAFLGLLWDCRPRLVWSAYRECNTRWQRFTWYARRTDAHDAAKFLRDRYGHPTYVLPTLWLPLHIYIDSPYICLCYGSFREQLTAYIPYRLQCPYCDDWCESAAWFNCPKCHGEQWILPWKWVWVKLALYRVSLRLWLWGRTTETCRICGGTGHHPDFFDECPTCHGYGRERHWSWLWRPAK